MISQPRIRAAAAVLAGVLVAGSLAACGGGNDGRGDATGLAPEPTAGTWRPWVLRSGSAIMVPPPPGEDSTRAKADLAEVTTLAAQRTPEVRAVIDKWGGPLLTQPWTVQILEAVSKSAKNPPLSSRNYALLHVAMYDATIATWHWKYEYDQDPPEGVETVGTAGPDPSYPSEHAAIAGAASRVLAHLYPDLAAGRLDEMAEEAGMSRVQAGTNTSSDVEAGLALGRAVADAVIARADSDGSDRKWNGSRPTGIGRGPEFWEPIPGVVSPPIEPLAGTWRTWVLRSGNQFRPPPPPAYGTPEFVAAAERLLEVRRNLTPEQDAAAHFYAGEEGSSLPAGVVVDVSSADVLKAAAGELAGVARLSVPRGARAMALVTIAMADAGIAAWDAKFTYWNPRPENAIRDLGLDPNFKPIISTPRFPAYPSGSAGYAGSAEVVLTYLFPSKAAEFHMRAEDQAMSRIWGGIHWEYDEVSKDIGREIGALVVERARKDRADQA
ncbi:MAG: vanadium-dependent haloperoxidase [Acidimicrobiales bacterium]